MAVYDPEMLFDYYNSRLECLGIGAEVEHTAQLTQLDRIAAAAEGVGPPILALWILGRFRTKALSQPGEGI